MLAKVGKKWDEKLQNDAKLSTKSGISTTREIEAKNLVGQAP